MEKRIYNSLLDSSDNHKFMKYRDPKIYGVSIISRNPILDSNVPIGYVLDCSIRDALYTQTVDMDCASRFSLDEATHLAASLNKLFPEYFCVFLIPTYKVPFEYGKQGEYTIQSQLDF